MAMGNDKLVKREQTIQKNFKLLSEYAHPTKYSTQQPKMINFSQIILNPVINGFVDAQRTHLMPDNSVIGLLFSEFRLEFDRLKSNNK